jgi:hypothetical protein
MTIKYKFNKSSEARDCVVESVELETLHISKRTITEEELYELNSNFDNDYQRFIVEVVSIDNSDMDKSLSKCKVVLDLSTDTITIKGSGTHIQTWQDNYVEDVELYIENKTVEIKTFTSQQELKDYINTIQEPIEFIAESDIDQVLMKEWIGEWEEKHFVYDNEIEADFTVEKGYKNTCWTFRYKNQVKYNSTIDGVISTKTGSPKLNFNWTFNIK